MSATDEEEIVLLYALYMCGGRPSKGRATQFILTNHLLKEEEGDFNTVSTDESRIANRIAWTRQNLKNKSQLSMPSHGIWAITEKGVQRLERVYPTRGAPRVGYQGKTGMNSRDPSSATPSELHIIGMENQGSSFLATLG